MQTPLRAGWAAIALLISSCGGDNASSPATPAPTPTPTPAPSPTPSPTPTPVARPSIDRLKAALPFGEQRTITPVSVAFATSNSTGYAGGTTIGLTDPRVRLLGGLYLNGPTYPFTEFMATQAINVKVPLVAHNTFSFQRYGLMAGLEFVLPGGQNEFEIYFLDASALVPVELAIDGRLTNDGGFGVDWRSDGSFRFMRFALPVSSQARRITLYTSSTPLGSVRLPGGGTLLPLPTDPAYAASIVFEGDSMTEGSVASLATKTWPMHAADRLGITNPIVVAVGGSGYLAHRVGDAAIPERIENVTKAVNGGPPDAAVIASGINECANTPAQLAALNTAAFSYFRALRAAAPNMVIFVAGPFTDYQNANYSDAAYACRDALFQAAGQVSMTYTIDVSDWVTFANRDTVFNGITNGPHPVDAGHAIYGQRAAAAMGTIIAGL